MLLQVQGCAVRGDFSVGCEDVVHLVVEKSVTVELQVGRIDAAEPVSLDALTA